MRLEIKNKRRTIMKHFKRPLCILLTMLMILPMAFMGVSAETSTPDVDAVTPGTVLYSQDFENVATGAAAAALFPNTSTAYPGFYEFSMPTGVFEGKSAKLWPSSTWAFPTICSAEDLQGQTKYTIKLNFQGSFDSSSKAFGIRFAGYSDTTAEGHYVTFSYGNYVYPFYYSSSNTKTKLGKNGGENTGAAEFDWSDKMTLVIEVDSDNQTAGIYLQSGVSKNKTLNLIHTMPLKTKDVSSIHFCSMGLTTVVDNIQITAGGIDDVPSVTDSCQLSAVKDGKYSIRFNAGFNGKLANVKEVGYKVVATWNDGTADKSHTYVKGSNTVFTSILAEVDGTIEEYTAEELGGDYIFALAIDDVPATEGMPITFAFTSYVKTDSATIYGATKTVTITYDGTALSHS